MLETRRSFKLEQPAAAADSQELFEAVGHTEKSDYLERDVGPLMDALGVWRFNNQKGWDAD